MTKTEKILKTFNQKERNYLSFEAIRQSKILLAQNFFTKLPDNCKDSVQEFLFNET